MEYAEIERLPHVTFDACHETSPSEIYTQQESETAIIFEARARNDAFEIQDGLVERDFRAKISTTDDLPWDFHAIVETNGCNCLQFFHCVEVSSISRMYLHP